MHRHMLIGNACPAAEHLRAELILGYIVEYETISRTVYQLSWRLDQLRWYSVLEEGDLLLRNKESR